MTAKATNLLNIGLMLVSLAAACALPFELFLFAYAVLGPLHYLTEIAWLGEREFFMRRPGDKWVLGAIAVLVLLGQRSVFGAAHFAAIARVTPHLMVVALGLAWVFGRAAGTRERVVGVLCVLALAAAFELFDAPSRALFALFVVTIVHVCVFTGAFILFGALRSRSWSGHASFVVFLACCAAALLLPAALQTEPSGYVASSYRPFAQLNVDLGRIFGMQDVPGSLQPAANYSALFTSSGGTAVMRLIAFAYTYHYLNWFSKTSIIGWHRVDRRKLALAVAVWIASIALYAVDYQLGLRWLLLLSTAHVLFEFPLNHISFAGIGRDLFSLVAPRRSAA
jgi:hypothetical protein